MDDERDELDPDDELMTFTADELRERSGELSEVFDAWLRAIADDMEALDDERVVLKFFPIPEGVSGFDPATIRSRDHFVWSLGEHFAAVLAIPDPVEGREASSTRRSRIPRTTRIV